MPKDRSLEADLVRAVGDRSQVFAAVLDGMSEGVIVVDTDAVVIVANRASKKVLGVREGDRLEDLGRLLGRPPEILPRALRGEVVEDQEQLIKPAAHPEGLVIIGSARPLRDEAGKLLGAVVVFRDVTARKNAEKALAQRTEELARSNVDLQQFVSACSHDLQSPLRKIISFGEMLTRRAGPILDETSRHFLERMVIAARRMSQLVDDLLQYSRLSSDSRDFEVVDLKEAALDVAAELRRPLHETGGRIDVGDLPRVEAHPYQMRQLFRQMLGNSLKFRSPERAPQISVSGRARDDGFVELDIADNGIGFEPRDASAIFEPFRRLQSPDQHEGSGIGLAICRRIATRHGGNISARSTPGQGATFTVVLPARRKP